MRQRIALSMLVVLTAASTAAQSAFEVASIKVSPFAGTGFIGIRTENGRFLAQHVSVYDLICYAYELEEFQVSGGPGWAHSPDLYGNDRYEVNATSPAESSLPQFRQMLQVLLKDRFQLTAHQGAKDVPSYVLTQSDSASKLKPSVLAPGQSPSSWSSGRQESKYEAAAVSMKTLTSVLRTAAGRPVVDRTGLTGTYAFTLRYATSDAPDPAVTAPSIFTAVREQLGLRLEPAPVPFNALIIDKIERPSEN